MKRTVDAWQDVGWPVLAVIGAFCLLCGISTVSAYFRVQYVPPALGAYMVGSLVALGFITRAIRRGTLTPEELGLGSNGWRPDYRLFGLVYTILLVVFLYLTSGEEPADGQAKRLVPFGDYCFWFFFLLQASLAELLIFVSIGYCLPEKWLRLRGFPTWQAILLAGIFSSVTFGLHHYALEPQYHKWSLLTIPVMWINFVYFIPTRNFQLTLLLHNAVAAVGFSQSQYSPEANEFDSPAAYLGWFFITVFIIAFSLPYLLLHVLEWWSTRRRSVGATVTDSTEAARLQPAEA